MPRKKRRKNQKNLKKNTNPKYYRAVWEPEINLDPESLKEISGIFLVILGSFFILSFLNWGGSLGRLLLKFSFQYLGYTAYFLPLVFFYLGYNLLIEKEDKKKVIFWGFGLILLALSGIFHIFLPQKEALNLAQQGGGGGILGYFLRNLLEPILGKGGFFIVFLGLLLIGARVSFDLAFKELFKIISQRKEKESSLKPEVSLQTDSETKKPAFSLPSFTSKILSPSSKEKTEEKEEEKEKSFAAFSKILPPLDLLEDSATKPSGGDIKKNAEIIKKTLANFGIPVEVVEINVGPTVTQYALKPAEDVKLSKIVALNNNLALALAAHPIRIEAPIPGKPYVGIEVPNKVRATVRLKEIIQSPAFAKSSYALTFGLGQNVAGEVVVDHLEGMPHLLVAGSTGSGKSICINSIILSFLYRNTPDQLRLILIDPKRVELNVYNDIPHLLVPVVVDHKEAISALKWAVKEMERRYKLFEKSLKRDIVSYNKMPGIEKLPYIVVFIDELADLMMLAPKEVEHAIVRLSQLARATGIHLVIATQRPSVDVITGLIKANITARIAFATASQVDSRTILDMAGAEKLLGKGDMLFISSTTSKPKRLQGAFVSENEVVKVVDFWKSQGEPQYVEEVLKMPIQSGVVGETADDELFDEAAELVVATQKASASFLQRRFRIGYARAARLIDLLEERGIIGPGEGAKPREVLVKSQDELKMLLELEERKDDAI